MQELMCVCYHGYGNNFPQNDADKINSFLLSICERKEESIIRSFVIIEINLFLHDVSNSPLPDGTLNNDIPLYLTLRETVHP